ALAFAGAIRKNIVRPPALEIPATPNCDALDRRKLERPVDPSAATPFRRANVPVRVIIKRNQNDGFTQSPQPKRAEIMEIARAVENEWPNFLSEFAVEFFDYPLRRRET